MVIKKKPILLNLTDGRREALEKIAKTKEKNLTAIINDAIDKFIEQSESKKVKGVFDTDVDANFKLGGETNLWG